MRILSTLVMTAVLAVTAGQAFAQDATAEILSILRSKRVFITSQVFNGNLGGLKGADSICQNAASQAGLDGVFMAWLSTISPADSPGSRFTTHSVGAYIDTVGNTVAANWGDLTDGTINISIDRDENMGFQSGKNNVWTATSQFGGAVGPNCSSWTDGTLFTSGIIGDSSKSDYRWTYSVRGNCSSLRHLYCIEQ